MNILLSLLSGMLIGFSYPPYTGWALFFCMVPLWVAWARSVSWKTTLLYGFISQFTLTLIGFNWVSFVAQEFGQLPKSASIGVLIGFCCFASLHIMFPGLIVNRIYSSQQKRHLSYFLSLAIWTGILEQFYPMIFPWNFGYPTYFNHWKMAQTAELWGFATISTIVLLINSILAFGVLRKQLVRSFIACVIIFLTLQGLGHYLEQRIPKENLSLNTLLVQPNIGNFDKFYAERGVGFQAPIVDKLLYLTDAGLKSTPDKTALVIWPETAFPDELDPYYMPQRYPALLSDFIKARDLTLVTGSYSKDPPDISKRTYNGVFLLNEIGESKLSYRKHILLAFGEYFPGAEYFPILKELVPAVSDFGRGVGPIIFEHLNTRFAPLICYEILNSTYVGEFVNMGAQVLLNFTNDSWYGDKTEPFQHLVMGAARSIEFRRPIVRATNTGISALIKADGSFEFMSVQSQEWFKAFKIPYLDSPPKTLYSAIIKFVPYFTLALGLLLLYLGKRQNVSR